MKKFMKAAAAIVLALTMTAPVFAAPTDNTDTETTEKVQATTAPKATVKPLIKFSDVTADFAWAEPFINEMASLGLISGYEDGTYRPDNDVTRLEALSLFARAMGSVEDVNAEILELAHEKYDDVIEDYGLSWGTDEIAYLMYKGALKKTDLDTYLKDQEKNTPMKRYEAAIIITKAMGGEEEAKADLGVVLGYTDQRDIPQSALQYVGYASDNGIMEGMDDGSFSPNTSVKRSQMAVMLSRTVDATDYTFEKLKIAEVDTATRTITANDSNGEAKSFVYTDDTVMRSLGDEVIAKELPVAVDAVFTLSGETLVSVDTVSKEPDKTIKGVFSNTSTTSGKTSVRLTPDGEEDAQSYVCDESVVVIYDGSPATIRSFTKGDVVTVELVNGKVAKITGESKTSTITGAIVESIDIENGITMTISHGNDEYNGKTYEISSDVIVKKNDATLALDSIYKGDKVSLTLEYGIITKINASSTKKVVEGTISGISYSSQSTTMDVKVNGEVETYQIPKDIEILINGEEGTLYDFRVNDAVKITIESDAITKIVATATQESSGTITGVVTGVNTSYGVISVLPAGSEDAKQAFCKDGSTTFVTADGASKKMKDIKVGQTVEIKGTVSNGVFVGKLVIIVAEAE